MTTTQPVADGSGDGPQREHIRRAALDPGRYCAAHRRGHGGPTLLLRLVLAGESGARRGCQCRHAANNHHFTQYRPWDSRPSCFAVPTPLNHAHRQDSLVISAARANARCALSSRMRMETRRAAARVIALARRPPWPSGSLSGGLGHRCCCGRRYSFHAQRPRWSR
jgi:hypothetical protein